MPVDPTYLGLIQDVTGNTVSVSLDESTISGLAFIDGQGYRIGQVGSFVRISLGYVNLFGVVSQVGAGAVPERLAAQEPHGYRWMTVQLIGEGTAPSGFRRGISQYPTVGDRVYVVTTEDLRSIYGRENAPNFVKVGHLASAESIPALVDVSPVPFSIHRLWFEFHKAMYATHTAQQAAQTPATEALALDAAGQPIQAGDALRVIPPQYQSIAPARVFLSASNLNFRRPLDYLATKLRDPRFNFMFRPGPWLPGLQDPPAADLDQLLSQWLGGERPITILDLSGIPSSVLNQVVGVVLRIIYDALFWARNLSEGGRERPILVVLEEAHT
jgi:hypothetical protein